jgi:hypothetical protein
MGVQPVEARTSRRPADVQGNRDQLATIEDDEVLVDMDALPFLRVA